MRFFLLSSLVTMATAAYDLDYFDNLRTNAALRTSATNSASNPDRLWQVTTTDADETFNLAQITNFLAFSDGKGKLRASVEDDLAAVLMAIHHFNNPELSPHLTPADLEGCNIKLTAEFFDTRYSPIHSTRLFTNILQRENTIEEPNSAGVIGAYRSAVTSPLAILTGVNDIPQISYGSTSTDFDVKEQYPLFGRTIQSSTGEAQVALDVFKSLDATHIGVLFVTDAFGSALQKAFQDAASDADIVTDSVAFSFSADDDSPEIRNAIESLGKTKFRLFYVIAFEVHYEAIMTAAYDQGLIGDEFLWVFDGTDAATFHKAANYTPGSPLDLATRGVGLINVEGGLRTEIFYPGVENVPPVLDDPTTSYERFRSAWRSTIEDPEFEAYARSRYPQELEEFANYNPNYEFRMEPSVYAPFLYDAISGLGLAYCRAATAANGTFAGQDVFQEFSNLDFDGASGQVRIMPETGTRDFTTEMFILLNVQPVEELDESGNQVFKLVPSKYYQNGWTPIAGRDYQYGGGSTVTPQSLPDPNMNMNYIGDTGRAVGYTLMAIVAFGALASFAWLIWFREERVVRSSQPLFLFMVALGSLVMSSSIIPLSLEEPVPESGLNAACMSAPWLYLSGAVIAFSSLLAKTRGVHQAYTNPDLDFIHVTSCDIFGTFFVLYIVNFIVMISWQFVAPLEWNRLYRDSTDIFDRPVESYGTCSNDDALPFVVVILILNISILIVANYWAYQARNIETEYHESRYIGISMASILQAWCMGIPILIVVWDNPQAKFFVEAGIIFVTALAVLLLILIPKMMAIHTDRVKAAAETKRLAYTTFTAKRERKEQYANEHSDCKHHNKDDEPSDDPVKEVDETPSHVVKSDETKATSESTQDIVSAAAEEVKSILSATMPASGSSRMSGLVKNISQSMRFSSNNRDMDGMGIRVTHNPRSERNLKMAGGREYSRAQLQHLEKSEELNEVPDESDNLPITTVQAQDGSEFRGRRQEEAEEHGEGEETEPVGDTTSDGPRQQQGDEEEQEEGQPAKEDNAQTRSQ